MEMEGKFMASEVKSFKVHPDYESEEITFRQKFGWKFVSTQEVYNKDTHLERGISDIILDTTTSVTETVHYVKLTFQRDRDVVNPKLLELESRIDRLSPPIAPHQWGDLAMLGGYLLCFPSYFIMKSGNKKRMRQYQYASQKYEAELNALLAEVDSLQ